MTAPGKIFVMVPGEGEGGAWHTRPGHAGKDQGWLGDRASGKPGFYCGL